MNPFTPSSEKYRHANTTDFIVQNLPLYLAEDDYRHIDSLLINNAILTSQALQEGNLPLLLAATHDIVHKPYRKKLIPNFEIIQQIVKEDTDGILLISGSGSTCLCIAKKELSTVARLKIASLPNHWQCL